jgi:PAS domain S-box-containing protein
MGALRAVADAASTARPLRDRIEAAIRAGETGEVLHEVVRDLRTAAYRTSDFLDDIAAVRDVLARGQDEGRTLELWRRADAFAGSALRADATTRAAVLDTVQRGYAELDTDGRVRLANPAMLELLPGILGQKLSVRFGRDQGLVETLLANGSDRLLHLSLETGRGEVPVSAEFGPILVGGELRGSYAVVAEVSQNFKIKAKSFEAASFGVIRLDLDSRIDFMNGHARELLGRSADAPAGSAFADLVCEPDRPAITRAMAAVTRDEGSFDIVNLIRCGGRPPLRARVSFIPELDTLERITGILAFIRSLEIPHARDRIRAACEHYADPKGMLREVLAVIGEVIPYDQAFFGVYSENMDHYRMVLPDPELTQPPHRRWYAVPEPLKSWIVGDKTYSGLRKFFDEHPEVAHYQNDPLTQGLLQGGLEYFISLPVKSECKATNVLSLMTRTPECYGDAEYQKLRELGVDQALRMAQDGYRKRQRDHARRLLRKCARAGGIDDLARLLARGVAELLDIEHVSVSRVNRLRARLELVCQFDGTAVDGGNGRYSLPAEWHQPLDAGMLGETLHRGEKLRQEGKTPEILTIDDLHDPQEDTHGYIDELKCTRSAACVPIELDGTISWLLNAESATSHVFCGPDLDLLKWLIEEVHDTIDRMFQAALSKNLLDLTDQAIVVVSAEGKIRRVNRAAVLLFGWPEETLRGRLFQELGADSESQAILANELATSERHLQLLNSRGESLPMIASERSSSEEYDHRIWVLSDLRQQSWQGEFRYLRETVHQVAQQTRVPLMLAENLARRARKFLEDGRSRSEIGDFVEKAIKQLGKAEITYERLTEGLRSGREGLPHGIRLDLGRLITGLLEELPQEDRQQINLAPRRGRLPCIHGEPSQIDFVFRSLVFYLLRIKAIDGRVTIALKAAGDSVVAQLSTDTAIAVPDRAHHSDDPLCRMQNLARDAAVLASDAIREIVRRHDGRFVEPVLGTSEARFSVSFPAADQKRAERS